MTTPHPDEARLYEQLDKLEIEHLTEEHQAVFTVEESQSIKADLPGGHTKNLFLKDKSAQHVLICAISDTPIRLNKLHPHIGVKRLSFGREAALFDHLGVRPGSVTLFSIINDKDHMVRLVLDRALFDHEFVWFHPLRNTASTRIRSDQIIKFAQATGHEPMVLDLARLSETPSGG
jgi:Ala-tRNA(Pro) deacylase